MYYYTTHLTPVGKATLACDGAQLIGLWLEGQKYHGGTISNELTEKNDIPIFEQAKRWLNMYFAGEKPAISDLQLAPVGGEFRHEVWKVLCKIPYGTVTTYGKIAKEIAAKMNKKNMSSQAVGGAVGHNPISLIIPCHRVVGSDGSLTGYAGGIGTKVKLLELEGVDLTNLYIPRKGSAL